MNYFISTNEYIVRLSLKGMPKLNNLIHAIRESAVSIKESQSDIFFIDSSELSTPFDITDQYSVINQLDQLGLSRKTQIVIVTSLTSFERTTLENMGFNRGWNVHTFKKLNIAKNWMDNYLHMKNVSQNSNVC